ncbi:MAG: hypothetical protein ABL962_20930, partial [Fimbriimonadaceae bacterium]
YIPSKTDRSVDFHSEARQDIIDAAMSFDIEKIVARYIRDNGLTEEVAREHEIEIKRYLAMCAINPKAHYGMRGPIDELWHTFVIFTRDYARFCKEVAGRFIHHIPETPEERGRGSDNYARFLKDYEETFGHPAPPQYWPRPAVPDVTADCQGCNSCSQGEAFPTRPPITVEAHCGECNGCGDSG